ncbi:MAG TPA: PEGA domain-containing protein [Polyangiaceae bacterium]|nr:PEGA domain-containing protein [Polyangiaceae bacterium]
MRARCRLANKLSAFGPLVAFGLLAPPAFAQRSPTDPIAAEALFNAAKEALRQGDWAGACDKFQKSMDLDPSVSTLVKVAKCQQHDGKLATAWYGYQRALKMNREADYSERRRDELENYIAAAATELEPRLPKLRVVVVPAPNGLQVYRDNELISSAILGEAVPVDPGEHAITARAPGYVDVRQTVTIREAETAQVSLSLTQVPQAVAPSPSTRPDSTGDLAPPANPESKGNIAPDRPSKGPNPADTRSPWRTVAFVVGGAGIAALGTAGFFGLRTIDLVNQSNPDCDPTGCGTKGSNLRREARDYQTVAWVLAGSGVAALGIGITLLAVTPRNRHRNDTADAARFGVSVTPSLIVVRGSF